MQSDIQKAVEAGKLSQAAGQALASLTPGTYVNHKSWGFGEVDAVDFLLNQVTIHFKGKRSHPMQLQYAAESLVAIDSDHILVQKHKDLHAIKAKARSAPAEVIAIILRSNGGRATQEQITTVLVPDVFSDSEFKKWWTGAKTALKKDGHFVIPAKKNEAIELRDAPVSHADSYLTVFSAARALKDQIAAAETIIRNIPEFKDAVAQLAPVVASCNEAARKAQRLHPTDALTLILTRDELIDNVNGLVRGDDSVTAAAFLRDEERNLVTLLDTIPAVRLKRALAATVEAFPDSWVEKAINLALKGGTRLVAESARLLTTQGNAEALRGALIRGISERSLSSAVLQWLCNERDGEFSNLITHELLGAILSALERDQHNEKKDRKLHDLLMNDSELLPDLISDCHAENLRETMRKLLLTTVFEDLNKRSLLGRIIRLYPEVAGMVAGEAVEREEPLIVSWDSLKQRQDDYEDLIKKKIPENSKEIAIAREHGDLKENAEFKAAKEMQRILMRRRAEMEIQLSRARGNDFKNPDTTQVSIGTVVKVKGKDGVQNSFTILGAWDGDPENGILSYQAGIAQGLLHKKVGDLVEVPTEDGVRALEIVSIAAWLEA